MLHMAFSTLSGRREGLEGESSPPWLLTGLTSTCTSSPSSVLTDRCWALDKCKGGRLGKPSACMLSMLLEGISLEVAGGFSNPTAACTACTASDWSAVEVGVRGVKSGWGWGPPSDECCPSLEERASFRLAAAFGSRAFRWWGCLATGVLPPTNPPGASGFPGELVGLCKDDATLLTPATFVCASDWG